MSNQIARELLDEQLNSFDPLTSAPGYVNKECALKAIEKALSPPPIVIEELLSFGAKQMRAVLDDGHDDETALYSALEAMGLSAALSTLQKEEEVGRPFSNDTGHKP